MIEQAVQAINSLTPTSSPTEDEPMIMTNPDVNVETPCVNLTCASPILNRAMQEGWMDGWMDGWIDGSTKYECKQ